MKRAILIFILAAVAVILSVFWLVSANIKVNLMELMPLAVLVLVVGLAVFIGIKRLMSARRGEPAEDELSKKIQVKTASISYYISIYLWLFIMYYSERLEMADHTLIGIGIFGMAVVYVLCWVILSIRGLRDE